MQSFRPLFLGLLVGAAACSAFARVKAEPRSAVVREQTAPPGSSGLTIRSFEAAGDAKAGKGAISGASISHNLDGLNALRAKAGVPALKLDARLCDFARQGSLELQRTHVPHGHFKSADIWGSGFENAAAENQGDPNGWTPGEVNLCIDQILQAMMDEGPGGGHHDTILSGTYNRVGIGLVLDRKARLYLTNDFSG